MAVCAKVLGLTEGGVLHTWDLLTTNAPSASPVHTYTPSHMPKACVQQQQQQLLGSLEVSGDGKLALLGLPQHGAVQVVDVARNELVLHHSAAHTTQVAWSTDNGSFASGDNCGKTWLWG